jgi:hypothetical protein
MDDAKFDRLARVFAKAVSRRQMAAVISAAIGVLGQQGARGSQLAPATCGEQGAVCTLVLGCCDGLTCVTSAVNTSYGICVPGDGGMVSTGTTLISPFSETAVEDVSSLLETTSVTPATDLLAERQARIAETRARKDTRKDTKRTEQQTKLDTNRAQRKTRLDTKRAALRSRKDEKRNRQREARDPEEAPSGPQLDLTLLLREADGDSTTDGNRLVPIDVVRVTNRDDVNVLLTAIETIKGAFNGAELSTPQFTLGLGESYSFISGIRTDDAANAANDKYHWLDKVACDGTIPRQGYRVKAAFSRGAESHEFVVHCHKRRVTGAIETSAATTRRMRNKNAEQKHTRTVKQQKKKKR